MNRTARILVGVSFWVVALLLAGRYASQAAQRSVAGSVSLAQYMAGPRDLIERTDPSGLLRRNDPVFRQAGEAGWRQVGHVVGRSDRKGLEHTGPNAPITIAWYDSEVDAAACQFTLHQNSGRLDQVVAIMLPLEKRAKIEAKIAGVMRDHGEEMVAAFTPLVRQSIERSLPIIEEEFRLASRRHHSEIEALASRLNQEVVDERLIPLARREILPIVREHGQPPVEQIGRELWDRASLWRFGWRAVYDKAPLPERNLVQEEWDRFVQQEALPVFEAHMDDIVVAVQRVLTDVAENRQVRLELASVAQELANDPEARALVRTILQETFVENPRLHDVWKEVWNSREARDALELASDRLEPLVREIGDELFGTPETGIDPNFARVLRNQILRKDRRWIVAEPGDAPAVANQVIRPSAAPMTFPLVYLADGFEGQGD